MTNKRTEIKYIIPQEDASKIKIQLKKLFPSNNSTYNFRSLYFDNIDNTCYFDNLNGINPREKYRIRIYNLDTNKIFLECKTKYNSASEKERCLITNSELDSILSHNLNFQSNDKLYKKFLIKQSNSCFIPKIIIEYNRFATESPTKDVRITIDENIKSSIDINNFLNESICFSSISSFKFCIMEIKYKLIFPEYLNNIINSTNLRREAFSKYYYGRKHLS